MVVKISDINLQDIGPINDFKIELGPFNLIYGLNERGKTFLVEFILKSLFRNVGPWKFRSLPNQGIVSVTGLEEDTVSFFPDSDKKIEDFILESEQRQLINMARLLVIKGAELSMVETEPGGINKAILKEYLSSEYVLDEVQANISPTIKSATYDDGLISGHRRGELKKRVDDQEKLVNIDQLFERLDQHYSGGARALLHKELDEINFDISMQIEAKRHYAYLLDQQIKRYQNQRKKISAELLEKLISDFGLFLRLKDDIHKKEDDRLKVVEKAKDYSWLKNAISTYEKRSVHIKKIPSRIYYVFMALSLLSVFFFIFIDIPIGSLISAIVLFIAALVYIRKIWKSMEQAIDEDEVHKIFEEFQKRFDQPLTGLPLMKSILETIEADHFSAETLEKQLTEEQTQLHSLKGEISDNIFQLTNKREPPENWETTIQGIRIFLNDIDAKISDRKEDLARLNVESEEYRKDKVDVDFDTQVLNGLQEKRIDIQEQFDEALKKIQDLKQVICYETGDKLTIEWEDLIQNLKEKRFEISNEYKQKTAEIIAKILVNEILVEVREKEDEQIREGLKSTNILKPLKHITKRYDRIDLVERDLVVSDSMNKFVLSELSTAAQEQVLLALRIGFSAKLFGDEKLFIILDDAFQHSDWQRRKWLIKETISLAKSGWQIIYFTMDDHIRDLFNEAGNSVFKSDYVFREI